MFVVAVIALSGLYLIFRDLIPYIAAQRTGAIRTLGHNRKLVLRSEEPVRFDALCRNRIEGVTTGAVTIVAGLAGAFVSLVAPFLILPVWAIVAARAKR